MGKKGGWQKPWRKGENYLAGFGEYQGDWRIQIKNFVNIYFELRGNKLVVSEAPFNQS